MNELIKAKTGLHVFENEKFGKVRVVRVGNEVWFSGKDVATVLGYARPHEAVRDHCKYAKLFRSGDLAHLNNINDLQLNPRGELFINQALRDRNDSGGWNGFRGRHPFHWRFNGHYFI